MQKIILAFSGGLDTSFCIPFLKAKGYSVVTVTVNTGGFSVKELKKIALQAKQLGAIKHYTKDSQNKLYKNFASYLIKANYLKGGVYPACVGPERNVIAAEVANIAKQEKTIIVAHGSTGAGNDQVRFDLALKALIPGCIIVAPVRDENFTREQEIEFLHTYGFHNNPEKSKYSINKGLLGTTISGAETLNPEQELPNAIWPTVKYATVNDATVNHTDEKTPFHVTLQFQKGLPVGLHSMGIHSMGIHSMGIHGMRLHGMGLHSMRLHGMGLHGMRLHGKKMPGVEIIKKLNQLGAAHGFGNDYHIGTTIIGIKGRIAFEAPALKMLIKAHSELEKLVLTSKQIFWKNILGITYGDLIHEGLYFDPLLRDIEAFLNASNAHVEGEVGIRIYKGNLTITSLKSPYSLMNSKSGTYGEKTGNWNGQEAQGFCKLYGMESVNAFLTHQKT